MKKRTVGRRLSVVLALIVVAAIAVPAAGQEEFPWPDGDWAGVISGSGSAAGSSDGGRRGSGTAQASGGFSLTVSAGVASGDYGITWSGEGSSDDGENTTQAVIQESGLIEGEAGLPLLVRESYSGSVTVDGFSFPIPGGSPASGPTPLLADSSSCEMIEGHFVGKLGVLEQAFATAGISAAAEERFVAFRAGADDPSSREAYAAAAERLGDLQTGLVQLALLVTPDNASATLAEAELIIIEAEAILAGLDGLAECDSVDTALFRLGISHGLEVLFASLFEVAGEDAALLERLVVDALRSGVGHTAFVKDMAAPAIASAAETAAAAGDADALFQLGFAALMLGCADVYDEILVLYEGAIG